ncbi:MAG: DUF1254 domain-containing protein [Rhizomicrobium sp.]
MMRALRLLPWLLATLVVAAAVHVASVWYLPHLVMTRAMARMGAVNAIHHGARATAAIHGVVRPSPDLLYSVCPFDVSERPLHVIAPVPAGTYWSVSVFDDATNNIFVRNDSQTKGTVDFFIAGPHQDKEPAGEVVHAPGVRGLVVFRTLVNDEHRFAELDAARRKAACVPYQ